MEKYDQKLSPEEQERDSKKMADIALDNIDVYFKTTFDMDPDQLLIDTGHRALRKDFVDNAVEYGQDLFAMAKATSGAQRKKYALGLMKLESIIGTRAFQKVYDALLTDADAVEKLRLQGVLEEELKDWVAEDELIN